MSNYATNDYYTVKEKCSAWDIGVFPQCNSLSPVAFYIFCTYILFLQDWIIRFFPHNSNSLINWSFFFSTLVTLAACSIYQQSYVTLCNDYVLIKCLDSNISTWIQYYRRMLRWVDVSMHGKMCLSKMSKQVVIYNSRGALLVCRRRVLHSCY